LHNEKFLEDPVELNELVYARTPSFFERARGQEVKEDLMGWKTAPAKKYSQCVYELFQQLRGDIDNGKKNALPALVKQILSLGKGFVCDVASGGAPGILFVLRLSHRWDASV